MDQVFDGSLHHGTFDLRCTVVNCGVHSRLFTFTYDLDPLGNRVPDNLRGPYINEGHGHGGDYRMFQDGSLYSWEADSSGRQFVRSFQLVRRDNEYSDGYPDLPNFGFAIGLPFWVCPVHTGLYRDDFDLLLKIVQEAADEEELRAQMP